MNLFYSKHSYSIFSTKGNPDQIHIYKMPLPTWVTIINQLAITHHRHLFLLKIIKKNSFPKSNPLPKLQIQK